MAACRGIASVKSALVLAMLVVVLLSVDPSRAEDCDQNAIASGMRPCFGAPAAAPGSACCDAIKAVKSTLDPSNECICKLALGAAAFSPAQIASVIENCVGASAVPSCLN